jgi:hypothetical protein
MKKISKLNSIKVKVMAALLAAVTMFSALTINPAKVSAAVTNITDIRQNVLDIYDTTEGLINRITDADIEKMKKVGISTLIGALHEFVPGGKMISPVIQELLGCAFLDKQLSLDDINDNINNLYSRIDQFENDMKNELKNIISIENFDYALFTPYNSEIQGIVNAIKAVQSSSQYTLKQKLAIIGAQIDADIEWKKGNSPFVGFTSVTKKLNSANLVGGNDMFTVIYNYFKARCMFSGEAIDMSREIIDDIMKNYMSGYTVLIECLTAQLLVNALENKDGIDPYYLSHISKNTNEILAKINELNNVVIGTVRNGSLDKTGTVAEKYNKILRTDRQIFVNKGKSNIQLAGVVDVTNHNTFKSKNEDQAVDYFNDNIYNNAWHLSGAQIKDLADYARSKGKTIREILVANDIHTAHVPANTYLVTDKAYDDLGVVDFLVGFTGSVHLHGYYKGINIDDRNAAEVEVLMWNHGCNGYFADTWDFAEPGNVGTIRTAY